MQIKKNIEKEIKRQKIFEKERKKEIKKTFMERNK